MEVVFQRVAYGRGQRRVIFDIEQNEPRLPHQLNRPARDDERSQESDQRVERPKPEHCARDESDEGKHRSRGIGQYMHIGRAQIVIVMRGRLIAMAMGM